MTKDDRQSNDPDRDAEQVEQPAKDAPGILIEDPEPVGGEPYDDNTEDTNK